MDECDRCYQEVPLTQVTIERGVVMCSNCGISRCNFDGKISCSSLNKTE
jgi:hypothetical protein